MPTRYRQPESYGPEAPPPLEERTMVPCLYVTGAAIEVTPHVMRLVGWVELPDLGGETVERRICVRFAMPIEAAVQLKNAMKDVLPKR